MSKKAILFLTNGFEEAEALVTADVLRRGGVDLTIASVTGELTVTGSRDIKIITDALFENEIENDYDAIILPGGPGTVNYFENENLMSYIKKLSENKDILLAAICAAPGVFGALGLLRNKRATCYPGHENKLTGAILSENPYETDGNIITGRSAGCVFDFAFAVLGYICGDEVSKKIRAAMIYRC